MSAELRVDEVRENSMFDDQTPPDVAWDLSPDSADPSSLHASNGHAPQAGVVIATLSTLGAVDPTPVPVRVSEDGVDTPTLSLIPARMSRDLVVLRGDAGTALTSYEKVAGRMLHKAWNRTSLFFTSSQAHQGATEAAINLATMLSRHAESALLVELQLTEPTLWSLLGKPPVKAGFEEALRGQASFDDCLYRIAGEKLDVLLVKQPMTADEADHLSGSLNDFLEWAEEKFAWMIVDCPPVLAPAWTRWFSLNADPVVLVAESKTTKRHELRKAAGRLGDRLAGTILSESQRTRHAS